MLGENMGRTFLPITPRHAIDGDAIARIEYKGFCFYATQMMEVIDVQLTRLNASWANE